VELLCLEAMVTVLAKPAFPQKSCGDRPL
jgi:hypothetical protein